MKQLTLLLAILISTISIAQKQIQLNADISINNQYSNQETNVTIIENNIKEVKLNICNKLIYNLDYNKEYIIIFDSKGYQPRSIHFNNYTNNIMNLTCYFNINLQPSNNTEILEIARVLYDENMKEFTYKLSKYFK